MLSIVKIEMYFFKLNILTNSLLIISIFSNHKAWLNIYNNANTSTIYTYIVLDNSKDVT